MCRLSLLPAILLLLTISISAQDFETLNNQAYEERKNKNYLRAIELCTQALSKKTNARSYFIRGDCYYDRKEYQSAINDFNSGLSYYTEYYGSDTKEKATTYYFLARAKQELSRCSDAIKDFNTSLSYNYSEAAFLYWNRGACYYSLAKYKEADDDYQQAALRFTDSRKISDVYMDRAYCQNKQGNYSAANNHFTSAISYYANNYLAYWNRGYNKYWEAKYTEALSDYNKALEILVASGSTASTFDLVSIYKSKSSVHSLLKQYDEALAALGKCIETEPNQPDHYISRASIYKSMKNYEKARNEYENAITLETDNKKKSNTFLTRSMMYWEMLDYKNCLVDLNKAIELDPADGMNFWHRSMLYGYKKNYPLAIKDCNTAIELYKADSFSTASLYWLRAEHRTRSGDYNGAKEDYQVYLKYYPRSYASYYELGRLFREHLKNNDLANANFAKAAELALASKDSSKYSYIKLMTGKKEEAFAVMTDLVERSVGKDYSYKWNLHNMACLYSLAGNTVKGLEYLDKSLAAGFDDHRHLVNDRDLVLLMKLPQWKTILAKYKVPVVIP